MLATGYDVIGTNHRQCADRSFESNFPANVHPGKVVIEAFACELPLSLRHSMQQMERPPVWLNLEYLTAESWIDGCHGLPSRQDQLTKFFFFPGFSVKVAVCCAKHAVCHTTAMATTKRTTPAVLSASSPAATSQPNELFISLFGYEKMPPCLLCLSAGQPPTPCAA